MKGVKGGRVEGKRLGKFKHQNIKLGAASV